ncbi:hypothetical protein ZEAMMB73_Zm00001d051748 [Zea mays]|uniref:Uncharacterized protein n=1 Tax=Zea mays TaxID=4577 RepID=A0A1D6Q9L3_MAIZE|nr:hypothetical protein ZEAMMB73_Zm00001d051748 [Zea mays]
MLGEKLRSTCVDLPQARDVGMDGLGHGVPLPVRVSPRCRNPDVDRSRLNLVAVRFKTEIRQQENKTKKMKPKIYVKTHGRLATSQDVDIIFFDFINPLGPSR